MKYSILIIRLRLYNLTNVILDYDKLLYLINFKSKKNGH